MTTKKTLIKTEQKQVITIFPSQSPRNTSDHLLR